ncbi:hypothetical protein BVX93_01105 [bacterium B13(2017)]|nr:hypothetical protein BVX93_01105 [bacterium B13(2017)]
MSDTIQDNINENDELSFLRHDRKKDSQKKIRVIVRLSSEHIYESFAYDISPSGLFVIVKSEKILEKLELNKQLEVYIEYGFDHMLSAKGFITRVQKNNDPHQIKGFAMSFNQISDENKKLLIKMISAL